MPYTFTKQEKEQLKQQYLDNIRKLNAYLDDDEKIKPDLAALEKKLNDPSQAWIYKKGLEMHEADAKKKDISRRLCDKFKDLRVKGKPYPLERYIHLELIPSDDPEAMAYNEEVIKEYLQYPEAVVQRRYQEMVKANFGDVAKIANCKDVEAMKLFYADKNYTLLQDCFTAVKSLQDTTIKTYLNDDAKEYLTSVYKNFEPMVDMCEMAVNVEPGYIAIPNLTQEQKAVLINGVNDLEKDHPELSKTLNKTVAQQGYIDITREEFKRYFGKLKELGIDLNDDDALCRYCGVLRKEDGNIEYISIPRWTNVKDFQGEPGLAVLSPDQAKNIQQIFTKDFTKEPGYKRPVMPEKFKEPLGKRARDAFIFTRAINQDKTIAELDSAPLSQVAEEIRGNFGERLFNTTSPEYKNLTAALKDYENPKHVGYQQTRPVKFAANQYLIHKGVKTREEAMDLPSPAKDRALLCFDLIESFQKAEGPNVPKMVPGTKEEILPPKKDAPERWPAIDDPNDLNENLGPVQNDEQLDIPELQEDLDGPQDDLDAPQ